jgi:hypothetical protein
MVDDQLRGLQRVDLVRVAAQRGHGIAHGGEVDDGGHAGEVLHQHARRAILNLGVRLCLRVPVGERLDVGALDGDAVLEAQQVLQQDLHRKGSRALLATASTRKIW